MVRWNPSALRRPLLIVAGIAAMVSMLAWLMGAFRTRLPPRSEPLPSAARPAGERLTLSPVRTRRTEDAVGTVRAVHETVVASRILARVRTLAIQRAGQPVAKDDVLVELEDGDLRALADQARAALRVAETRRDKAQLDLARTEALAKEGIAASDRLETDRAARTAAEAEVERSRQGVAAAESALSFATVRAPIAGIVVDKKVNVGDVVQPGQTICALYDPTRLQLVAVVREELAGRLRIGQDVDVTLDALGQDCRGQVAEIVPAAEARSRSFEVKVTGPCHTGVVTGMFGRLHVPLDEIDELRVPARAVQSIGQLDFVTVFAGDTPARRYVRTGRTTGDAIEITSGLAAGETILVPPQPR